MNRSIYILIAVFFNTYLSAQVGIGTTSPEQELHIAGKYSTIRFDSFNTVHSPLYNDGIKLAPVFVDGRGDLKLGDNINYHGDKGINFLLEDFNFIPDDPYQVGVNTGKVVNTIVGQSYTESTFKTVEFEVPLAALIEIKYGITIMVQGSDLAEGPPYTEITYDESVKIGLFFCIDINSNQGNGLDADEYAKKYGFNGQYYETEEGGIDGYSYINSQGYLSLPKGTHRIYFFGVVEDPIQNFTSIGYGGGMDYLKIRIYN